jgi:FKBP-type peptidyl-prolyl cis-trans isomerase SlyD
MAGSGAFVFRQEARPPGQRREKSMQVAKNTVVAIDYTLRDSTGNVLDSSDGGEPLRYIHGTGAIIKGLEAVLEGKSPGDRLDVSLAAADAYGDRDESLVVEVERARFADVPDLAVGMQFRAKSTGGERVFTVTGIAGEQVTIDGNHPLAGQALHFDVQVKDVREATAEEIDHGHVH